MANSFDIAVTLVLAHEGGYTAGLADDPGGETNFGISKRAYPQLDIKALTVEDAKNIYSRDYWTQAMIDAPSQQVANCALDCAVNQGPGACRNLYDDDLHTFQLRRLLRYASGPPSNHHSWFSRVLDVG